MSVGGIRKERGDVRRKNCEMRRRQNGPCWRIWADGSCKKKNLQSICLTMSSLERGGRKEKVSKNLQKEEEELLLERVVGFDRNWSGKDPMCYRSIAH